MKPQLFCVLAVCFVVCSLVSSAPTTRRARKKKRPTPSSVVSPISYLEKYGYLITGVQHSEKSMESAIRIFQAFSGLPETGILDRATREKLAAKRCGVEDIIGTARMGSQLKLETNGSSLFRNRRYSVGGTKWSKTHLTYYFQNYTPDLTRAQTRSAIQRAFQLWADVSPMSFSESSTVDADILIEFAAGQHSDGWASAFDGPGGTLAHAYFPEHGDAHFDEDENFTEGSDEGVNLFIVAAHEFGHSLGLSHSSDMSALMYPWYLGYIANYRLPRDDINGIQQLYGKPDVERPTPSGGGGGGTAGGNPNLPVCDSRWDSATYYAPDDVVYAFKDKFVWAINDQGIMDGYPAKTKKVFTGAPSLVNAVVSTGSRTYMFRGNKVWRFYNRELEPSFPRTNTDGVPSYPNAALQWGGDGKIYLFKGSRFYEFHEHDLSVGPSMKIAKKWSGIPNKIDAALQWRNGKTYLFKNNKYWRFNDNKMTVAKDYPKSRSQYWMGCGLPDGQFIPSKFVLAPPPSGDTPGGM